MTSQRFVQTHGNFGNALCFENIEKSIMHAGFMSSGHMLQTNKTAFDQTAMQMASYSVDSSWMNLTKLVDGALVESFRGKDS